ncbi:MAG TPA: UDP-N-acetylmuramoyl-L-alanine--D-glutamate ligase, partial [Bacillales bacterium]|nr:UDP-N-acetylmuramoyl-L-alanine--D-glutamate ligase [Bacillales bacterium]
KDNTIVIELSSFQLMGINEFNPKIAIITNIYDAHLDYHGTKREYIEAKANITKNQTAAEFLIVNSEQEDVMEIARRSKATIVPFSAKNELNNGAYVRDGWICFNDEKIMQINEIALPGTHNLENILSAMAAAKLSGVENDDIEAVLKTFTGVKHRLQFVAEKENRKFYNDSKATNILATVNALAAFKNPVILLTGGLDRGNEFDELIPYLTNVKALITFGQSAPKIERVGNVAGIKMITRVDNVEKAVPVAFEHSEPGDVILLSPACASWDQFKSFEIRGDIFIEAVHKLK